MEERYDILGKIGQGGLGAVYRAYDNHLNREVAIKRILPGVATDLEKEATKQLTKEAGALSALQHPHIVTIYDVGVDKDGSFVVMELLHGVTIDDVVKKAVMTWADFREFALQTQEALIAAQDMNLVHRDLKPANVMLTWLPSGKFQVKIVDFGLAKFTPKPSLQTIDQKDGIFGSIFFMAPEQFERVELDSRTDMYAIGCVYYFALTGVHPFDGETGPQVMASHLEHRVFPLQQLRPDLPRWVTDWIMWHINRLPEHRPVKARDALALFIQNDQLGDQAPVPEEPVAPRGRPSLLIPGAAPVAPAAVQESLTSLVKAAPQPITPPENFGRASVHTSSQPRIETASVLVPAADAPAPAQVAAPPAATPPPPEIRPAPVPTTGLTGTAKPRLMIPGAKPTETTPIAAAAPTAPPAPAPPPPPVAVPVATATPAAIPVTVPVAVTPLAARPAPPVTAAIPKPVAIAKATPTASPPTAPLARPIPTAALAPGAPRTAAIQPTPTAKQSTPPQSTTPQPGNKPLKKAAISNSAKATLATVLGIVIILVVWLMIERRSKAKTHDRYMELTAIAVDLTKKELPVTGKDIDILLSYATSNSDVSGRETIYRGLYIAKSTDGTNVDQKILNYTVSTSMSENIRAKLISHVIGGRINAGHKDSATAQTLIDFINTNPKPESATAALNTVKSMVADEHLPSFLNLLQSTASGDVRKRCEEILVTIIKQSSNRDALVAGIDSAYQSASTPEIKQALLRVLASTGAAKAKELILSHLKGSDKTMQIAAADASRNWPDETLAETLLTTIDDIGDAPLRARIFQSCRDYLALDSTRSDDKNELLWKLLAAAAKNGSDQETLITSLMKNTTYRTTPWARAILKQFEENGANDSVSDLADRALSKIDSLSEDQNKGADDIPLEE